MAGRKRTGGGTVARPAPKPSDALTAYMAKLSGYYGYDDDDADNSPVINHSPDPHGYHKVTADPFQSRIVRSSRFPTVIIPSATHEGVSMGFDGRKSASVVAIDPGNPKGNLVVDYSKVTRSIMEAAVDGSSNPAQVFRKLQAQTIGEAAAAAEGDVVDDEVPDAAGATAGTGQPTQSVEKTAAAAPSYPPPWPGAMWPGYPVYPPPGYPMPPGYMQAPLERPVAPSPVVAPTPLPVPDPRFDMLVQQLEQMGNTMATMQRSLAGKEPTPEPTPARPRKVGEPLRKPAETFESVPPNRVRRPKNSDRDERRRARARREREEQETPEPEREPEGRTRRNRGKEEARVERPQAGERMKVVFDMGADGGIMKATYDKVVNADDLVALVIDTRRDSDSQWIPGTNDQKVFTITGKMIQRDSRGREILVKSTEHVTSFGFMYRVGPFDHVLLLKRNVEPQGDADVRPDGEKGGD